VDLDRFKDGADPPQAEFKDLGFGYTKAVSTHLKTPPRTKPTATLLLSRETDGVVA
jgi:hypothetical protein